MGSRAGLAVARGHHQLDQRGVLKEKAPLYRIPVYR